MPSKQAAMERAKRAMPKKTCWGLYRLRNEKEAPGSRKKPKPRSHCGGVGMLRGAAGSLPPPPPPPSPHLQKVEHESSHPAPAVEAVHVGDALGPVGLKDGDDACGEEPVTTRAGSGPIRPSRPPPVLTDEGDDQRQAVEQSVQRLGGALGFVPEDPVNQESCRREGKMSILGGPKASSRSHSSSCCPRHSLPSCSSGDFEGHSWDKAFILRSCSPSPWRKTMPSTMQRGWTLNWRRLCQATPPR